LATYLIIIYLQRGDRDIRLSTTGLIRILLLGLALVSGVLAALKNFPIVNLPMAVLMAVAFMHLGAVVGMICFSIACRLLKKPWVINISQNHSL
jgi:pilus assembly protein TadC